MSTQLDEEQPDLVSEVQDLARLHVDLARAEVRDGTRRLQRGVALLIMAFVATSLVVLAATVTVFLYLQTHVAPWIAAALTTVLLGVFAAAAVRLGRWQLQGTRALLLPRTRALLGELFTWRNEKSTDS
jgi:hypothetical protein